MPIWNWRNKNVVTLFGSRNVSLKNTEPRLTTTFQSFNLKKKETFEKKNIIIISPFKKIWYDTLIIVIDIICASYELVIYNS